MVGFPETDLHIERFQSHPLLLIRELPEPSRHCSTPRLEVVQPGPRCFPVASLLEDRLAFGLKATTPSSQCRELLAYQF
jgi:hypothetical protein